MIVKVFIVEVTDNIGGKMGCNKEWTINCGTMAAVKIAVAAFVIVVLKIWQGAMDWIHSTNVWWFVVVLVISWIYAARNMKMGNCKANVKTKKK